MKIDQIKVYLQIHRRFIGDYILPNIPLEGSLIVSKTIGKGVEMVSRPIGSCLEILGGFHTNVKMEFFNHLFIQLELHQTGSHASNHIQSLFYITVNP